MTVSKMDHIAIVVANLEEARAFYEKALGLSVSHVEEVEAEEVRVAFIPLGETEIELMQPTTLDSGVARFLEKRGPGLHHICLEVEDIEAAMARLRDSGVQMLHESPVIGSDGRKYVFAHPKSTFGVLIELYQMKKPDPR
jgi:methylmalonyl-CoA epimerase